MNKRVGIFTTLGDYTSSAQANGGIGSSAFHLINTFIEQGWEVHTLLSNDAAKVSDLDPRLKYEVIEEIYTILPEELRKEREKYYAPINISNYLIDYLQRHNLDKVVLFGNFWWLKNVQDYVANNCDYIIAAEDTLPTREQYARHHIKSKRKYFYISDRRAILESLSLPEEKWMSSAATKSYSLPSDTWDESFYFFGRIDKFKGLTSAVALLKNEDFKIYGTPEGPHKTLVPFYVGRGNPSIHLPELKSSAFVLLSIVESGIPHSLLEALNCGIPAIISNFFKSESEEDRIMGVTLREIGPIRLKQNGVVLSILGGKKVSKADINIALEYEGHLDIIKDHIRSLDRQAIYKFASDSFCSTTQFNKIVKKFENLVL